jgi:hypothetical protein
MTSAVFDMLAAEAAVAVEVSMGLVAVVAVVVLSVALRLEQASALPSEGWREEPPQQEEEAV